MKVQATCKECRFWQKDGITKASMTCAFAEEGPDFVPYGGRARKACRFFDKDSAEIIGILHTELWARVEARVEEGR